MIRVLESVLDSLVFPEDTDVVRNQWRPVHHVDETQNVVPGGLCMRTDLRILFWTLVNQRQLYWVEFWREYRLGAQLEMLVTNAPSDDEIQHLGAQLMKRLPELFSMIIVEDIEPVLLHGDLWHGNCGTDINGVSCIFDPAAYYGHSEADLGIARMLGGFDVTFWEAYHKEIPKAAGYERRAVLYEVHHHLNHYNIFGSGYREGARTLLVELLNST